MIDATWEELVREMKARSDGLVIIAERPAKDDPSSAVTYVEYQGSMAHTLGLAHYAVSRLSPPPSGIERTGDDHFD